MSFINQSWNRPSASGLPVPNITLASPIKYAGTPLNPNGVGYTFSATGDKVDCASLPLFSAMNLSAQLMTAESDLRLELMIYKRESGGQNSAGKRKESGYKHPTHSGDIGTTSLGGPQTIALPKTRYRGGNNAQGTLTRTEWRVTNNGQQILIDTLGDFLIARQIGYRDANGQQQLLDAYVQTNTRAHSGSQSRVPLNVFGYSPMFKPLYFRFRFSVTDQSDPRGQRITGPESQTIAFSSSVHPFAVNEEQTFSLGAVCNNVQNGYQFRRFNAWFESQTSSNG